MLPTATKWRKEAHPMPATTPEKQRGPRLTAEMLAQAGSLLRELDWRLLHWLLRYPLQRADDLVIGVARWASRATVYRHLQGLEASALVESVLPKTPGEGKRLYHLSNLGLHVLARRLERSAGELARDYQAGEAGLLRVVARLSPLLLLQNVVNGLVTGAAEAMTTQGRRPELVRWTWQRDVTHHFHSREQVTRFFVDGAVALCIRTRQSDGSTSDRWYGLFILYAELDDERLMRLRLERLLCWRESPERWPVYQHMPPVLILARSPRQRDHWQRTCETSALQLRLEPLRGALVSLAPEESAHVNPWLLNWSTLATAESSHLQDLLRPLPPSAFLPPLHLEESEDEERESHAPPNTPAAPLSPGTHARRSLLIRGDLMRRSAQIAQGELEEREILSLLGLRLTPGMWAILRLLLAHPLLSDEELADLLDLQRRSVRQKLYELHRLRCLEPITTIVGKRWRLCERGLRLIAAANYIHIHMITIAPERMASLDMSPYVLRGEAWLLQHIQHTAGVYGFFAGLAKIAKQHPEQMLRWWETGAACERRYRVGEQWYNLRPDALAEYRVGQLQVRFWLEWDRGTMNARDLATKFASYAQYFDSREWARERLPLPWLLCVTPEIAQERRVQRAAQSALSHLPGWVFWTTTEELLSECGPLAPIWSLGTPLRGQVSSSSGSFRQRVFQTLPKKLSHETSLQV